MVQRAYRYRFYPDAEQELLLRRTHPSLPSWEGMGVGWFSIKRWRREQKGGMRGRRESDTNKHPQCLLVGKNKKS